MNSGRRLTSFRVITLSASALLVASCSTASWYQAAKYRGQAECRKQPAGAAYEECMRQYEKTRNEYLKERQEAIQK